MANPELLNRIRGEYLEMPGLRLTHAQACRLWGLDPETCAAALGDLLIERFLHRTRDGAYLALPVPRQLRGNASATSRLLERTQRTA